MTQPETLPEQKKSLDTMQVAPRSPDFSNASLADLERVTKDAEEKRERLSEDVIGALKKRLEELKQSKAIDENLHALQTHVSLVRALDIKAKPEADTSIVERFLAAPLRNIPWLKNLTARSVQRLGFTILAAMEKVPGILTAPLGFIGGSVVANLLPSFNFGNRKNVELDLKDARDAMRQINETITVTPVTSEDYVLYENILKQNIAKGVATASITEMAKQYVVLHRKNAPGAPITLSLGGILAPEELKNTVTQKEAAGRKERVKKAWGDRRITDVMFESNNAYRFSKGILSIPEGSLGTDDLPTDPAGKKLRESLRALPKAHSISIVESGNATVEWQDSETVTASIPSASTVSLPSLNNIIVNGKPSRISKIVIGGTDSLATDSISYGLVENKGVLTVHPEMLSALESTVRSLPFPDVIQGTIVWKYGNGNFMLHGTPVPIPSPKNSL